MDFVRVGYFIPLNGPLNGHPPSSSKDNLDHHFITADYAHVFVYLDYYYFRNQNQEMTINCSKTKFLTL